MYFWVCSIKQTRSVQACVFRVRRFVCAVLCLWLQSVFIIMVIIPTTLKLDFSISSSYCNHLSFFLCTSAAAKSDRKKSNINRCCNIFLLVFTVRKFPSTPSIYSQNPMFSNLKDYIVFVWRFGSPRFSEVLRAGFATLKDCVMTHEESPRVSDVLPIWKITSRHTTCLYTALSRGCKWNPEVQFDRAIPQYISAWSQRNTC